MLIHDVNAYIEKEFSCFGLNKRQELCRLLYDICWRDNVAPAQVVPDESVASGDFFQIKSYLLQKRFPSLTEIERSQIPPLTAFPSSPDYQVKAPSNDQHFQQVFYEREIAGGSFLMMLRKKLPGAHFNEISSYRDYCQRHVFTLADYNDRRKMLFIIREQYDFFLHCPCSKLSQPCGYHIMNAGMGCGFDCVYCYLQGYVNAPGIVLPGNLDEILEKFRDYYHSGMRLGTGQFTDSLFLDGLTEFSEKIIRYFQKFPDICFEFKTKSNCISGVLSVPASRNIIISWSLNPGKICESLESGTATLQERLEAARKCADAGYRVGFHFDPIVYYSGWDADYQEVVKNIFAAVPEASIAWISLGCLRMTLKLRQVIEQRFPQAEILLAEQIIGYDGKIRYPEKIRRQIYQMMINSIRGFSLQVPVYLCMEDHGLNQEFGIQPFDACSR